MLGARHNYLEPGIDIGPEDERPGYGKKEQGMQRPHLSYLHVILYTMTRGRIDPSTDQAGFLSLTTIGRKSGKVRTVYLLYFRDDGSYVVTASNGGSKAHPGWFFNVQNNPEVTIQVKGQQKKVVAEVAGPEKMRELWARLLEIAPMFASYPKRAEREIPMVILHPLGERQSQSKSA
jgi:deazaflavin-dependent oxidoreductase (nitroreductase family)